MSEQADSYHSLETLPTVSNPNEGIVRHSSPHRRRSISFEGNKKVPPPVPKRIIPSKVPTQPERKLPPVPPRRQVTKAITDGAFQQNLEDFQTAEANKSAPNLIMEASTSNLNENKLNQKSELVEKMKTTRQSRRAISIKPTDNITVFRSLRGNAQIKDIKLQAILDEKLETFQQKKNENEKMSSEALLNKKVHHVHINKSKPPPQCSQVSPRSNESHSQNTTSDNPNSNKNNNRKSIYSTLGKRQTILLEQMEEKWLDASDIFTKAENEGDEHSLDDYDEEEEENEEGEKDKAGYMEEEEESDDFLSFLTKPKEEDARSKQLSIHIYKEEKSPRSAAQLSTSPPAPIPTAVNAGAPIKKSKKIKKMKKKLFSRKAIENEAKQLEESARYFEKRSSKNLQRQKTNKQQKIWEAWQTSIKRNSLEDTGASKPKISESRFNSNKYQDHSNQLVSNVIANHDQPLSIVKDDENYIPNSRPPINGLGDNHNVIKTINLAGKEKCKDNITDNDEFPINHVIKEIRLLNQKAEEEEKEEEEKKIIDGTKVVPYWLIEWWLIKNSTSTPLIMAKHPLLELIIDNIEITKALQSLTTASDVNKIAYCLVQIFDGCGKIQILINYFIDNEIEQTTHNHTLFRVNSITTKILSSYSKVSGILYLKKLFSPLIEEMIKENISIEIDEKKLQNNLENDKNKGKKEKQDNIENLVEEQVQMLLKYTEKFLIRIKLMKKFLPMTFHFICAKLNESVTKKFDKESSYFAIGGFIFLRFICPAIVSPECFNITKLAIPPPVRRSLLLISKVIQNIANRVKNPKESFMQATSEFLQANQILISEFYDYLIEIPSLNDKNQQLPLIPISLVEESLSFIHKFILKNIEKLKELLIDKTEFSNVTFSISENLATILLKSSLLIELMRTVPFISDSSPFYKPYRLFIEFILLKRCFIVFEHLLPLLPDLYEKQIILESLFVFIHQNTDYSSSTSSFLSSFIHSFISYSIRGITKLSIDFDSPPPVSSNSNYLTFSNPIQIQSNPQPSLAIGTISPPSPHSPSFFPLSSSPTNLPTTSGVTPPTDPIYLSQGQNLRLPGAPTPVQIDPTYQKDPEALQEDSLFSLGLIGYFKLLTRDWVQKYWKVLINKVNTENEYLELDPQCALLDFNVSLANQRVTEIIRLFLEILYNNHDEIPSLLKEICALAQQKLAVKFPDIDRHFMVRFLFKYTFIRAISSPDCFQTISEPINCNAKRTFSVISKVFKQLFLHSTPFSDSILVSLNHVILSENDLVLTLFDSFLTPSTSVVYSLSVSWPVETQAFSVLHQSFTKHLELIKQSLGDATVNQDVIFNVYDRLSVVITLYRFRLRQRMSVKPNTKDVHAK